MAALSVSDYSTLSEIHESKSSQCKAVEKRIDVNDMNMSGAPMQLNLEQLSLNAKQDSNENVSGQNTLQVCLDIREFESGDMRPRARTIPSIQRAPPPLRLPEIKIEDFSDNHSSSDPANTDEGFFQVFASPPRRRANTCPDDLFRRKKNNRPPTPPPFLQQKALSKGRNKFNFQRKKLTQVTEDNFEPPAAGQLAGTEVKPESNRTMMAQCKLENSKNKAVLTKTDRHTKGYTFTGAKSTYTARPTNGLNSFTKDCPAVMRRAHTLSDTDSSHMRSWRRSWETEGK